MNFQPELFFHYLKIALILIAGFSCGTLAQNLIIRFARIQLMKHMIASSLVAIGFYLLLNVSLIAAFLYLASMLLDIHDLAFLAIVCVLPLFLHPSRGNIFQQALDIEKESHERRPQVEKIRLHDTLQASLNTSQKMEHKIKI